MGSPPRTLIKPHARVEQRVQHVGHDTKNDNEHREDKSERLHSWKIAALNSENQKLAEAVHAEDLLGDDRALKDLRNAERDQRYNRDQAVTQRVPHDHGTL